MSSRSVSDLSVPGVFTICDGEKGVEGSGFWPATPAKSDLVGVIGPAASAMCASASVLAGVGPLWARGRGLSVSLNEGELG